MGRVIVQRDKNSVQITASSTLVFHENGEVSVEVDGVEEATITPLPKNFSVRLKDEEPVDVAGRRGGTAPGR